MKKITFLFAILTISVPCAAATIISVDPNTFNFTADEGGPNPADQIVSISNIGGGTLDWTITESCGWLTAIPDSGSSTGEADAVILSVDISGLAWGNYNCELTVSDPGAENNPQIVSVDLDITGPIISLSQTTFNFTAEENGPNPADQIVTVRNAGIGTLNWTITEGCSWLEASPMAGTSTEDVNDITEVTLSVDIAGLTWGPYICDLTITDPCAMNNPQTVEINLGIGALYVPGNYPTIQAAIDAAVNGDIIIVAAGTYYENINFGGKNIVLTSMDPIDPNVVRDTIIDGSNSGPVVTFAGTETSACELTGFTITNGNSSGFYIQDGGGIDGYGTHASITNCIISGNVGGGFGGGLHDCDGTISNCLIDNNNAGVYANGLDYWSDGGGLAGCDGTITNCTITGNWANENGGGLHHCNGAITNCTIVGNSVSWYGGGLHMCDGVITNCIIWGNTADNGAQLYDSSVPAYSCMQDWAGGGLGNITLNPLFANPANDDYHLKSEFGRWDSNISSWVTDAVTSPCIDAGNPASDWTKELWPDGERINMGAYGGTAQASMSGNPVGSAADFNKDDSVDGLDLQMLADKWLLGEILLVEDINRNNFVDMVDVALFAQEWLWEQ